MDYHDSTKHPRLRPLFSISPSILHAATTCRSLRVYSASPQEDITAKVHSVSPPEDITVKSSSPSLLHAATTHHRGCRRLRVHSISPPEEITAKFDPSHRLSASTSDSTVEMSEQRVHSLPSKVVPTLPPTAPTHPTLTVDQVESDINQVQEDRGGLGEKVAQEKIADGVISGALLYIKDDFEAINRSSFLQIQGSAWIKKNKRWLSFTAKDLLLIGIILGW